MGTELILGGPGSGKTTHQLERMSNLLEKGLAPSQIAFVSFTKAAVDEARSRAMEKFDFDEKELPYFRTLHSMCFRELRLRRGDVLGASDWSKVAEAAAITLSGKMAEDEEVPGEGATEGDRALSILNYARAVRADPRAVWQAYSDGEVRWNTVRRLEDALLRYKGDSHKIEFPDMLTEYLKHGAPLPVRVAIVDEAQDLTAAQWGVVRKAFANVDSLWISGDDDQAIHTWAGAATRMFLSIEAPKYVLPISHRLPPEIWSVGQKIVDKISKRYPKDWSPAKHRGCVERVASLDAVDLDPTRGSWMLLARSGYQLRDVAAELRRRGLPYRTRTRNSVPQEHIRAILAWERRRRGVATEGENEDALEFATSEAKVHQPWFEALKVIPGTHRDYYRSILQSGYRLQDQPQILISTIHGVKGQEADHVVLLTDITAKIANAQAKDNDSEHRVFYVGATRARQSLTIVAAEDANLSYVV